MINGLCNGLEYLHEKLESPMCHLDLKPANVLLDENMTPKIADFGLSRLFGGDKTQITKSPLGT
jgi:serine/threonine protein kinase